MGGNDTSSTQYSVQTRVKLEFVMLGRGVPYFRVAMGARAVCKSNSDRGNIPTCKEKLTEQAYD